MTTPRLRNLLLSLLALFLASCVTRTPPAKLYILNSLQHDVAGARADRELVIGLGPVAIPEYLNRPQIVVRASCGPVAGGQDVCSELRPAEFDRWAEPLEESIVRVLAENLSVLLATERVVRHPWRPSTPIDFQVKVDLVRFDVDVRGRSVVTARWGVFEGKDDRELLLRRSSYEGQAVPDDYRTLVVVMSEALAALSREIAAAVESIPDRP